MVLERFLFDMESKKCWRCSSCSGDRPRKLLVWAKYSRHSSSSFEHLRTLLEILAALESRHRLGAFIHAFDLDACSSLEISSSRILLEFFLTNERSSSVGTCSRCSLLQLRASTLRNEAAELL